MICRASIPHLHAYGLRYFNHFALYQLKEDYKLAAYRNYTAEMLCACARGVGAEVTQTYAELIAAVEKPLSKRGETTLSEAQAAWEMTLEASRRAAEGGDKP